MITKMKQRKLRQLLAGICVTVMMSSVVTPAMSVYANEESTFEQNTEPVQEQPAENMSEPAPAPAPVQPVEISPVETTQVQAPAEQPIEAAPVQATVEQPIEEAPVQTTVEQPVEEAPVQATVEQPIEEAPVQTTVEQPIETAPVETPVEQAVETAAVEIPVETPIEQPIETAPVETPAEKAVETANVETPVETPAEQQIETAPVETPAEKAVETAAVEIPVETPAEQQIETAPVETPAEKAVETATVENIDEAPVEKPIEAAKVETPVEQTVETATVETQVEQNLIAAPSLKLMSVAPQNTLQSEAPEEKKEPENLTIRIGSIFKSNAKNPEDMLSEKTYVKTPGSGQGLTARGVWSEMYNGLGRVVTKDENGKSVVTYKATYKGVQYELLDMVLIETEPDEDGNLQPIFVKEKPDQNTVKSVSYKNDGSVVVTYNELDEKGKNKTKTYSAEEEITSLCFAPVYITSEKWLLEHDYIDNISTGSGSWSSTNWVSSYSHTFKDPDEQPHYQFKYWENEKTGETYKEGDKFIFTEPALPEGEKGDINSFATKYYEENGEVYKEVVKTYAYWKPSLTVNYNEFGEQTQSIETFDELQIYDITPEEKEEYAHYRFEGWYDENGNQIDKENDTMQAPEITKEANTAVTENVDAWWTPSVIINYFKNRNSSEVISAEDFSGTVETFDQVEVGANSVAEKAKSLISGISNISFAGWFYRANTNEDADTAVDAENNISGLRSLISLNGADGDPEAADAAEETTGAVKASDLQDGEEVTLTLLDKLSITKDKVKQTVVDVYAKFVTAFTATKTWEDDNDRDGLRPESVQVQLLKNGEEFGTPVTLDEQGSWSWQFTDLDAYDDDGNLIVYTLKEINIDSYKTKMTEEKNNDDVLTAVAIKNTHEPERITFTVSENWNDENDKDSLRPENVTVTVYANGEVIRTVEISSNDDWQALISGDDIYRYYDHGKTVAYTAAQADIAEYETSSEVKTEDDTVSGFFFTNVHTPAEEEPTTEPENSDPTPAVNPTPAADPAPAAVNPPATAAVIPAQPITFEPAVLPEAVLGAVREVAETVTAVLGAVREQPAQNQTEQVSGQAQVKTERVLGALRTVQTGDESNLVIYSILILLSLTGIAFYIGMEIRRRARQ